MTPVERLHQAREIAAAAARRRLIAEWLERHETLRAIRPRNDEERLAQWEALCLLEQARLERLGQNQSILYSSVIEVSIKSSIQ